LQKLTTQISGILELTAHAQNRHISTFGLKYDITHKNLQIGKLHIYKTISE